MSSARTLRGFLARFSLFRQVFRTSDDLFGSLIDWISMEGTHRGQEDDEEEMLQSLNGFPGEFQILYT